MGGGGSASKLFLLGDLSENFLTNIDQKIGEGGQVRSPPPIYTLLT